ncbi:hypothetical protein HHX38_11775 [Streptomyces sp. PKU-MA01144]|uniref:hypothetical protein n=1 Tax=Streptomyces sp. PKU-MA01144 TaxID=2729138 RepID=UPI001479EAA8|nr:hypothetical protein [Streptomyces sp. PKU-MA01144]NNJ04808.1 hypothetical protein [Streptomyces sp. PKU-MA01144]
MLDATPLQNAYQALLDAAATVADAATVTDADADADADSPDPAPPHGEWNADQILAHVSLVSAATIAAVANVAAGAHTTYDNRIALDAWTIERTIEHAGGNAGLRDRIGGQAAALCALAGGAALSDAELSTPAPVRLLSNGTLLADQPMPLRDIVTGLADAELPGHTRQLLDLLPGRAVAEATR